MYSLTNDFELHHCLILYAGEVEVRVEGGELNDELLKRSKQIVLQLGRVGVDAYYNSRCAERDRGVFADSCAKLFLDVEWIFPVQGGIALIDASVEDVVVELRGLAISINDDVGRYLTGWLCASTSTST